MYKYFFLLFDNTTGMTHLKKAYKHKLRICHTYWFSMATVVRRTHLCITLYIHLAVLFFVLDITGRQSDDKECEADV